MGTLNINVYINVRKIECVKSWKYLGNLVWSQILYKRILASKTLLMLYDALFTSAGNGQLNKSAY